MPVAAGARFDLDGEPFLFPLGLVQEEPPQSVIGVLFVGADLSPHARAADVEMPVDILIADRGDRQAEKLGDLKVVVRIPRRGRLHLNGSVVCGGEGGGRDINGLRHGAAIEGSQIDGALEIVIGGVVALGVGVGRRSGGGRPGGVAVFPFASQIDVVREKNQAGLVPSSRCVGGVAEVVGQKHEMVEAVTAGAPGGDVKPVAPHRRPELHPVVGGHLIVCAVELAVHGKVGAGGEIVVGVVIAVPDFRTTDDCVEPVFDVLGTGGSLIGRRKNPTGARRHHDRGR